MRVLVVGSTGTIGNRLSTVLKQNSVEVVSASRNSNSNESNSLQLDLSKITEDVKNIKKQEKFSAAVMCAAITDLRECESDPKLTSQININAQITLTEALLEAGTKCVVYLSSNRVFDGKSVNVNKDTKHSYTTEYGRQKAMAETELLKLGEAVRVIRITKVFSESNSLLTDWVSKLKSGQKIRAFMDVMVSPVTLDDTVKVIAEVIKSECESIMQFSATDEISYFDLAQFVARYLGVDARLVVAQNAEESGETPLEHSSLECSEFRSVAPSSSLIAVQKVLEKMVSS